MVAGLHTVIGLGKTGLSVVRFLRAQGIPVAVTDNRDNPPGLAECRETFPEVTVSVGAFNKVLLQHAAVWVPSPGVSLREAPFCNSSKPIIGDIGLFARHAKAPIIGITGSNGKSTVTTLLGEMAREAGLSVGVGGNLGTPALDLLSNPAADFYILELSSFQLETVPELPLHTAVVLNLSPDHLDRYPAYADYVAAKYRIYREASHAVVNRQLLAQYPLPEGISTQSFGLTKPRAADEFGFDAGVLWLGEERLLTSEQLKIKGAHNCENVLAALALGQSMGLPKAAMLRACINFVGLPHRCEFCGTTQGVSWYNDSKATNPGAAIAAIKGLAPSYSDNLIVIAGGQAKGADFTAMANLVQTHVKQLILIGEAAEMLSTVFGDRVPCQKADSLAQAIAYAKRVARKGDCVLLAPACASFDQFRDFGQRGDNFRQLVQEVCV